MNALFPSYYWRGRATGNIKSGDPLWIVRSVNGEPMRSDNHVMVRTANDEIIQVSYSRLKRAKPQDFMRPLL